MGIKGTVITPFEPSFLTRSSGFGLISDLLRVMSFTPGKQSLMRKHVFLVQNSNFESLKSAGSRIGGNMTSTPIESKFLKRFTKYFVLVEIEKERPLLNVRLISIKRRRSRKGRSLCEQRPSNNVDKLSHF